MFCRTTQLFVKNSPTPSDSMAVVDELVAMRSAMPGAVPLALDMLKVMLGRCYLGVGHVEGNVGALLP